MTNFFFFTIEARKVISYVNADVRRKITKRITTMIQTMNMVEREVKKITMFLK